MGGLAAGGGGVTELVKPFAFSGARGVVPFSLLIGVIVTGLGLNYTIWLRYSSAVP